MAPRKNGNTATVVATPMIGEGVGTVAVPAIHRGGVSPDRNANGARGLRTELAMAPVAPPAAGAFPGFTYHGGPVVGCPQIYTSFWGSLWLSDPTHIQRAGRLSQFCKDLVGSAYMNVLSQYGVGSGTTGIPGIFVRASFINNVPSVLTDGGIQGIIQTAINGGALPESSKPSNICLIIYLDENIQVNDPGAQLIMCAPQNDDAFGYHNHFTTTAGHPFYYAVIPGLNDACLHESCGSDNGCSLHLAETQEQRQTQVTSHEFAEMASDPELNAWFDPQRGENGDICNGESDTITVGPNTWTVQRQYSKFDDVQSNGANFCVTTAATPEPKQSPGPSGLMRAIATAKPVEPFHRLLPLPPVTFDLNSQQATMNDADVQAYASQVFHPLRPEHIMNDFPGFLHQVASVLSKAG